MKKVAIVYTSKFGHTKQYADWLAAHLGKEDADVINVATFNPTQLLAYKLIIFASGVYGDKMPVMDFVKKNIAGVSPAKTMFMAVSWYTTDSEEAVQKLMDENYPDQFKGKVPLYVLNSGIDKKKISVADKAKLLASQVMIEKKDGRSNDDINILAILKGYSDSTSEENLDSIKKGIEDFFDPKKSDAAKDLPPLKADRVAPAPRPVATPVPTPIPESKPAAEVKPEPKPEPKAEPVPKPMAASEMTSDADALSSLENAFKALKAPKPAAESKPKPEPAPKPMDVSEMTSDADALSSLENAFKALNAPKSAPKPEPVVEVKPEPKPEPVVEVKPEPKPEPVVEVKTEPKPIPKVTPAQAEVASSVKSAIKAMKNGSMSTNYSPAPAFEDMKSEDVSAIGSFDMNIGASEKIDAVEDSIIPAIGNIDLSADTGMRWESVTKAEQPKNEVSEPAQVMNEQPTKEEKAPVSAEAPKNSYMELFAKRRKKAEEEPAIEVKPEPVVETKPEPVVEVKSEPVIEVKPEPVVETKPEPVAEVKPSPIERPTSSTKQAAAVDVLSEFDFLSGAATSAPAESVKPVAPVNTAVDTTAAVDMDVYDFMDDSKPKASSRALNAVQDLAKAKAEAEKEAAKKAAEEAAAKAAEQSADITPAADNSFIEKMKMDMAALAEESEHELEQETTSESEEIDGFTFSNELDYDLGAIEIDTPPIGEVSLETIHTFDDFSPKESSADFDLKKLQEEINASIESNKINKEKMMNRYGKKQKEEVHNPFLVQFEEDESKSKKKKKENEIGSKRLEDPLDPDVFFSRPKKNTDFMMPSDTMPEIKFRNR